VVDLKMEAGLRVAPTPRPWNLASSSVLGLVGVAAGREKSLAGGGGHNVDDVLDAVFLLGGDVEVYPPSLLPLPPGENLNIRIGQ
jgi:hypothetical protein